MAPTLHRRDVAGLALVAVTIAVSILAYPRLPAELAVNFDAGGEANETMTKPLALAVPSGLALVLVVAFRVLPAIDPLGENVAAFQDYYDLLAVVAVGAVAYLHGLIVAWNLGVDFSIVQAIVPVLAVTYYVAGVVVEHAEQNWFVGIRTPWTLSSEEVWNRTHERTGILFKLAGPIALLALAFPQYLVPIAVAPVAVVALVATVYSFVVYRRVNERRGVSDGKG